MSTLNFPKFDSSSALDNAIMKYAQAIIDTAKEYYYNVYKDDIPYYMGIEVEKNRSYIRIVRIDVDKETGKQWGSSRSVHSFVDKMGNILKAASWKAPAKNGIRGTVYGNEYPLDVSGGIRYLR
ncbi:hypothetical protein MM5_177 [Morganella phage vB_Mm5]